MKCATTGTAVNAKEYQRPYVALQEAVSNEEERNNPVYIGTVRDATDLV